MDSDEGKLSKTHFFENIWSQFHQSALHQIETKIISKSNIMLIELKNLSFLSYGWVAEQSKARTTLNMDGTLKGVFPKAEINGTILMKIISLIYL